MAKTNTETARADVILNGQKANATLKEIEAAARAVNAEIRKLPVNSQEFVKKTEEFKKIKNRLNEVKGEISATGMSIDKMAQGFNKYFAMATAMAASFTGLIFSIKNMVSAQAELSDSLANIRKTTGMTAEEVEQLNSSFKKIDTRTSRQDLREMAVVAGQLGIAKDQIFSFVDSVDKLNVALGDEIQGGSQEVAKQMGTLRNVLTDMKTSNIADDMLRIGNAVNELGAAGFATAPVIVDFSNRIGGVGLTLGLTSDEVLGLSATLQELNVSTERGGTAVTKILQKMTTNTKDFARIAGMPVKEFTDLVNRDLMGAFVKVLEGSKRGGQSATLLAGIIKDLEVQGAGASEVFAKLGGNTEMLAEKIALAGGSLQGTDSIMKEFNIKNNNLAASLDKLKKDFYNLITLPGVNTFFNNQVQNIISLVNWFKDLPLIIEKYRVGLIAITGVTLIWIAAKTRSLQIAILNNLTMKEGILLKAKDAIVMEYLIIKEQLLTIWKGKGTVATKLATTAQMLWNAAVKANPIGLIIAGITALVGAIAAYEKYNSRAIALDKLKGSTTILLANANSKLQESYSKIEAQINKLSTLSVQEKKDLKEKLDLTIKSAEAELLLMEAKQKAIGKQAAKPTLWQGLKVIASGPSKQQEKLDYYSWENQKEATAPFDEGINDLRGNINKLKEESKNLSQVMNAEVFGDKIMLKTIDALDEKLRNYQVALRNTTAGSEEYNRIQQKIKETNKEIAKFQISDSVDEKKLEKAFEQLYNIRKSLNIATIDEIIDYEKKKLEEQKVWKMMSIEEQEKWELALRKEYLDKQDALKKERNEKGGTLGYQKLDNKTTSTGEYFTSEKRMGAPIGSVTGPDITGGGIEKDTQYWAAKANNVIGYAQTVFSQLGAINDMMSQNEDAQLARDEALNDAKKDNLKKQLDGKVITQKQYDASVAKMDAEMEKKKRKLVHDQAVRQKEISLVQAVINTALAVTSALTAGPIIGEVLAVLVGALGAVQIGMIASQEVPQAKKGKYNVIGEDDGKLYSDVPYAGKAETGIYNGPTLVAENGPELIVDAPTTKNIKMNYPEILQAIQYARVPQYASGNVPPLSPGGRSADALSLSKMIDILNKNIEEGNRINDQLRNELSRGIVADISFEKLRETTDKINSIESDVTK